MKSFKEYFRIREENLPTLGDEDNKSNKLFKIIRLAWKGHRGETLSFLRGLAKIDTGIAEALEEMKSSAEDEIDDSPVKKKKDQDVLVPPISDTSGSGNEDR